MAILNLIYDKYCMYRTATIVLATAHLISHTRVITELSSLLDATLPIRIRII